MPFNMIYKLLLKYFPKPVVIAIIVGVIALIIICSLMSGYFKVINFLDSKGAGKEGAHLIVKTILFSGTEDINYYKSKINAASRAAGKFQSGNAEDLARHFSKGFKNSRAEGNKLITDIGVFEFSSSPYSVKYSNDKGTGIIYLTRSFDGKLRDNGYSWSSK